MGQRELSIKGEVGFEKFLPINHFGVGSLFAVVIAKEQKVSFICREIFYELELFNSKNSEKLFNISQLF